MKAQEIPERMQDPGTSPCELCGLPVGRSREAATIDGRRARFCCPGCRHVFQILFNDPATQHENYRETELYRACVAAGLIPATEEDLLTLQKTRQEEEPRSREKEKVEEALSQEVVLHIPGMWCTACSWLLEEVLQRNEGVIRARVLFLTDTATITYLPHRVNVETLQKSVARLGYQAYLQEERTTEAAREKREWLMRFGVAAIFTCNIMMISFALYWGFFRELEREGITMFSYPLWLMATPVVFYSGWPILRRAAAGVRHLKMNMEALIAVGTLAAYFYSVVQIGVGGIHLYFDTAAMLVTLVLLGKFIETQAREKVSRGISELFTLTSGKVRLSAAGRERWVSAEGVRPNDRFTLDPRHRFPLDGVLVEGTAMVDQSFLTGESRPVKKGPGDEVHGGSLLLEGRPVLRATRTVQESSLGQMISLMQEALHNKDPYERLADRLTQVLVPAILVLAGATALVTAFSGHAPEEAFLRAVTVLVITCPCALGIATPLAKVAAIGRGRSEGVLVRDAAALERLKDVETMVFDKTGTLTEGAYLLRHHEFTGAAAQEHLEKVASLEMRSNHFLARELVQQARRGGMTLREVSHWEEWEGMGMGGMVDATEVVAGNRACMAFKGLSIPEHLETKAEGHEMKGLTVVFYALNGRVEGYFALGDHVRNSALQVISHLKSQGVACHVLSGDSPHTTGVIASALGIDVYRGGALPEDKVRHVKKLQEQGHRVAMVGDGVNDAAALAQADVGMAVGATADLLRDASDITLLSGKPEKILAARHLSGITTRIIRQNLFFAFLYNALGIPLAMTGLLNPLVAVLAMFASSLSVIGNTLRITRGYGWPMQWAAVKTAGSADSPENASSYSTRR